jgi:hypothetical protein
VADDHISRARKEIQKKIEAQELAKKHELQRRRIEIAGRGVKAYDKKNPVDAALAFKSYLSILEDLKGAPEGGLAPSYFDRKKDMAEMVLVAGVLWDLVKLYDRTSSPDKYAEFQGYMSKYIAFSRGMPFQTMCAESLRKYIRDNRAIHKTEFKDAYKMLKNSSCFVVTELEDVTRFETLPRLRRFRDEVLKRHSLGRSFVAWYYRRGPKWAARIASWPRWMRVCAAQFFDVLGFVISR